MASHLFFEAKVGANHDQRRADKEPNGKQGNEGSNRQRIRRLHRPMERVENANSDKQKQRKYARRLKSHDDLKKKMTHPESVGLPRLSVERLEDARTIIASKHTK